MRAAISPLGAPVAGPIRFFDLGVILRETEWESLARYAAEILSRSAADFGAMLRNISIGLACPLGGILVTTIRGRSEMNATLRFQSNVPHSDSGFAAASCNAQSSTESLSRLLG